MTSVVKVVLLILWCLYKVNLCAGNTNNAAANNSNSDEIFGPDHPYCKPFREGNSTRREFYSPGYPGNYTKNTQCYLQLYAGEKSFVRITFLGEYFDIEPSRNCENDFIRFIDGLPSDSANVIRQECGNTFPHDINSCGPNMTILFQSDGTIQGKGFQAKYEFVPVEASCTVEKATECSFTLSDLSGTFGTQDISVDRVNRSLDPKESLLCTWQFAVPDPYKVSVSFERFTLKTPNECKSNRLQIFNRSSSNVMSPAYSKEFCGVIAETVPDLVNTAVVNLHANYDKWQDVKFVAIYTAYTVKKSAALCHPGFYCGDTTCLDMSLRCNKVPNCKDRSDEIEDECKISTAAIMTPARIAILVPIVLGTVLASVLYGGCYLYKRCRDSDKSADLVCGTSSTMRANSLASGISGRFGRTNVLVLDSHDLDMDDDDPDNNGCYVPEVDLAEFHKRFNGCHTLPLMHPLCHEETPLELPPPPPPPPPPHHSQVPSLNHQQSQILADYEPDFPPPPPIYYNFDAAFKTRVPREDLEAEQIFGVPTTGEPEGMLPRSFESVKSAPDII